MVRHLLRSVLQVDDLQNVYFAAQKAETPSLSRSILDILNIKIEVSERDLAQIPRSGPVIAVANHPFGILDGMVLDQILHRGRSDFKILTNEMISELAELKERCITVDVAGGKAARETNVLAVRRTLTWLRQGHGIGIFPAGEVSHFRPTERCVTDPPWGTLAAKCVEKVNASVVPVYFAGKNSLTFQLAGLLHPRLRTARLPIELLNKRASTIEVRIGSPISAKELSQAGSEKLATDYMRARVYMLSCRTTRAATQVVSASKALNVDFRRARVAALIPAAPSKQLIESEIARLAQEGRCLVENDNYTVYAEQGDQLPVLLPELGRLRELTFRKVGEGTGKARDLDAFDNYYKHLILWHKKTATIAGSYRLAWTKDVVAERGAGGLYTSRLFRYAPGFFSRLGSAVELGRSFIAPDHQKDYAPLMILWQAIARCVAQRPDTPILFGAVSISAAYTETSRDMIVEFLRERSFRTDLADYVMPRCPFRSRLTRHRELCLIARCLPDVEDLPIADIEPQSGVPVLLRQYLRLGGRVAAFSVDAKFSNVLDALLIVDLRETSSKLLSKYMGPAASELFLKQATER